MPYEWNDDLKTGNTLIDSQHKELIKAINSLMVACSQGKGRAEIERTLIFLEQYTAKHFSDEEKLQLQYRYPDYQNHKRYHEGFKAVVRDLGAQLRAEGPTIALLGQVNARIGDWLIHHIKREDTRVAAHISKGP